MGTNHFLQFIKCKLPKIMFYCPTYIKLLKWQLWYYPIFKSCQHIYHFPHRILGILSVNNLTIRGILPLFTVFCVTLYSSYMGNIHDKNFICLENSNLFWPPLQRDKYFYISVWVVYAFLKCIIHYIDLYM